MSRTYAWSALTPRLRESIEAQPVDERTDRQCGCHERNDKWWLCQYHEGFQDAEAILLSDFDLLLGVTDAPDSESSR